MGISRSGSEAEDTWDRIPAMAFLAPRNVFCIEELLRFVSRE